MLLEIETLNTPHLIKINGNEDCLKEIYKQFPKKDSKIQASIQIETMTNQDIKISGEINFTPILPCHRCSLENSFPLDTKIEATARVIQNPIPTEKDAELNNRELDIYPILDGKIDIAQILIDTIELSIPNKVLFGDENGKCLKCHDKIDKPISYSSKSKDETNPFSILGSLKDKLN